MIINLKFKNWMSFRDETHLSLMATSERRLNARVPKIRKNPVLKISPISVLYGGNASGKSNLFSLLAFLKHIITKPATDEKKDIPVKFFILEKACAESLTEIAITFLSHDDTIYQYEIKLNRQEIVLEKLSIVDSTKVMDLYSRENNKVILVDKSLQDDESAKAFATVINRNQLFLAIAGNKVNSINTAYVWFRKQLTIISPSSFCGSMANLFASGEKSIQFAKLLSDLDTGMCQLGLEASDISALPISSIAEEIKEDLNEGDKAEINVKGIRFVVEKKEDTIIVKKLISYHRNSNGDKIPFDMQMESDGSVRLLDILPAFIDLTHDSSKKVYLIDELDRSWHYDLTRRLLGIYLSNCSEKSRMQLILSTHDLLLMDQSLFRRDEICLLERDRSGASSILSLANSPIRYDKDIRKLYLQGAIGGMPNLMRFGSLAPSTLYEK